MRRVVASVIISLCLLARPSSAFAGWTRFASAHFLFIGDVSRNDLREAAERLELFRETIARGFPAPLAGVTHPLPSPPTVVIVFEDDRSFAPFRPSFEGRPVEVAGYAASSEDSSYIAVNASRKDEAFGILFHEYAHLYLRQEIGTLPLWLNEGIAEFYETFESARAGRSAVVGMVNADNLEILEANALIGIDQLVSVGPQSPLYNEGDRRGLFYAESWALVHYLLCNGPENVARLQHLIAAAASGVPPRTAFAQALGADFAAVERDLAQYVRRKSFDARRLNVGPRVMPSRTFKGEPLPSSEVAAYLGDMLAHLGRIDDARMFLQGAIDKAPAPRAIAALGVLEMREGRLDAGQALLERAVAQAPDLAAAQRWLGRAYLQRAEAGDGDAQALYADARIALGWSLKVEPGHPAALLAVAKIDLATGEYIDHAAAMLRTLVDGAPGREDYALLLGEALLAQRDFTGATNLLAPLLTRGQTVETRSAARELLARLARLRAEP